MTFLKRSGARKRKKREFWKEQKGLCPGCQRTFEYAHVWTFDHIIPRSLGGTNGLNNLRLVCWKCNNKRGNRNILPVVHGNRGVAA